MLNNLTAVEVSDAARALLRMDGNCGRKYRRFLGRVLEGGGGHIHLVFATGGDTAPVFKAKKAFAEQRLLHLTEDLEGDLHLSVVSLTANAKTGDIRITCKVSLDVETAPMASLRYFCRSLSSLAGLLLRYEEDPAGVSGEFVEAQAAAKKRRAQFDRQQTRAMMQHMGFMRA